MAHDVQYRTGRGGERAVDDDRRGPNAIALLHDDHERVKQLFNRFTTQQGDRRALAEEIFEDLEVHAQIEERVFYPACASIDDETADDIAVSLEEHQGMKTLIRELRRMDPSDSRYEERFEELRESVLDHATEEEETVFPLAQSYLDVYGLGRTMAAMKAGGTLLAPLHAATAWWDSGPSQRWSDAAQDIGGMIRRHPAAALLIAASVLTLLSPGMFRSWKGR
jgi:hemerythrin superfamily protein